MKKTSIYLDPGASVILMHIHSFADLKQVLTPFLSIKTQRDAHEALILLLDIFSNICNLPLKENIYCSRICRFFLSGIYQISFIC